MLGHISLVSAPPPFLPPCEGGGGPLGTLHSHLRSRFYVPLNGKNLSGNQRDAGDEGTTSALSQVSQWYFLQCLYSFYFVFYLSL